MLIKDYKELKLNKYLEDVELDYIQDSIDNGNYKSFLKLIDFFVDEKALSLLKFNINEAMQDNEQKILISKKLELQGMLKLKTLLSNVSNILNKYVEKE